MKILKNSLYIFFIFASPLLYSQTNDYFQQQVTYKIDVALNVEQKTYGGTEIVTYKNNSSQPLDYIWFHFYPNAFKNKSTRYARECMRFRFSEFEFSDEEDRGYLDLLAAASDNQQLKWEYKKDNIDEIKIWLTEPLLPGEHITLHLDFKGKFPKVFSRIGYFDKTCFAATQWYPKVVVYDYEGWHPDSYLDFGEFYGEFGDYDVSITLPKHFVIDATGMLMDNLEEEQFIMDRVSRTKTFLEITDEKERIQFLKDWNTQVKDQRDFSKMKTVRFVADNVHDFAWFTGEKYMIFQKYHNDGILTIVLVRPENAYIWRDVPRYVEQTIWFYSTHVGAYQYPKASIVDGRLGIEGGMEYPMITIINLSDVKFLNLLENAVMHEVGHNWFYGMLGSNERKEAFLDEGLNTFYEHKYMEHFHGFNNYSNFRKLTKIDFLEDIGNWHYMHITYGTTIANQMEQVINQSCDQYTLMGYLGSVHKGVFMLLALEWLMGADTFSNGIHTYFERWAGKHPTSNDFFNIMNEISGKDLTWFFDEWYNKTTYSDFTITKKKRSRIQNGYETKIFIKNKGTMDGMPAPVYLITHAGDTLEGRWDGDSERPAIISHTSPVKRVEVNLKRILFESNYLNNAASLDIDINFLGQVPRFDSFPINVRPYYWYDESKDKNRVGLGFWAGNPLTHQYMTSGSFYYGTDSEVWGYYFKYSHRMIGWLWNYTDVTAAIYDKSGLKNISCDMRTAYMKPSDDGLKWVTGLSFDNIRVHDMAYLEPQIFESCNYSTVSARGELTIRRLLHTFSTAIDVEKAVTAFDSKADYVKVSMTSKYRYRFSKYLFGRCQLFGSGIWGDDIPRQELIYLGGDVDPKHQRFAFQRRGGMSPLRTWMYDSGMNLLGYARNGEYYPAGKAGAAIHFEVEYNRFGLPAFYITSGTLSQKTGDFGSDDIVSEFGIKYKIGFMTFVIPLYITDPAAGDDNFDFRFFINIDVAQNIRIGT